MCKVCARKGVLLGPSISICGSMHLNQRIWYQYSGWCGTCPKSITLFWPHINSCLFLLSSYAYPPSQSSNFNCQCYHWMRLQLDKGWHVFQCIPLNSVSPTAGPIVGKQILKYHHNLCLIRNNDLHLHTPNEIRCINILDGGVLQWLTAHK